MSDPVATPEKKVNSEVPETASPKPAPTATPKKATTIKFQCKQCQFNITRENDANLQRECPKCNVKSPYLDPAAQQKKAELKTLTASSSKAQRVSTKECSAAAAKGEKFHKYELGSCVFCRKREGDIEDPKTHIPGSTSKGDCVDGKKHMFKFSKCSACGLSELEYTKQQSQAGKTPTKGMSAKPITSTPTTRSSIGARSSIGVGATTTPATPSRASTTPKATTTTTTTPSKTTTTTSATPKPTATTPSKAATLATAAKPPGTATPTSKPLAKTINTTTTTPKTATTTTTTTTTKPAATAAPKPTGTTTTPTTPKKATIKFQCKQCQFNITRENDANLQRECPKCNVKSPYLDPAAQQKKAELKTLTSPASKAQRVSTKECSAAAAKGEKFHKYELGSCIFCRKREGDIEDPKTHIPGSTSKGDCVDGKKHMFKFSKCSACGLSELEYTKQQAALKKK